MVVEARDIDGELYISATNLVEAIERARESGKEMERAKWMCMLTPHERRMVRVRELCADAGYTVDQLMGKSSPKDVKLTHLRQDIWLEFREGGMSLADLGRFFKRDHTTIHYGISMAKERRNARNTGEEIRQAIEVAGGGSSEAVSEAGR
jgi:chromosomal replication initiation ATPase DnaA